MNKPSETNGGPAPGAVRTVQYSGAAPGGEFAGATPGPWRVEPQYTDRAVFPISHVIDDTCRGILAEANSQGGTPEQCSANARLIAAAPALLAERDAARAEARSLTASLDAAFAELRQRTAERDRLAAVITKAITDIDEIGECGYVACQLRAVLNEGRPA